MNRIQNAFAHGKTVIVFLTCGDPDLESTERFIETAARSGADLIELGIPFSDPTAEGKVIQEANLRALRGGATTDRIFEMVKRVRDRVEIPLVFAAYANVVFSYGIERFFSTAAASGADGIMLHDIPYEEMEEFAPVCEKYGMEYISQVSGESGNRIPMIAGKGRGFLCCAAFSESGSTDNGILSQAVAVTKSIREVSSLPVVLNAGNALENIQGMAACGDGVIVDVPVVERIAKYGREANASLAEYIGALKETLKKAGQ